MRESVIVTVDVVLFTLLDDELAVGLLRRADEPFKGRLALPGGYVHQQEDTDGLAAAARVLRDKTGIEAPYLEQLYTFADGARDPRGWSVSLAYYALVDRATLECQAKDAFSLVPVAELPRLPFDHNRIVDKGLERVQNKAAYSTLPCFLAGTVFTLAELQATYERVMGQKLDKSVFRRKLAELDFVEPTGEQREGAHRPAQLYRIQPKKSRMLFDKAL